MIFNRYYKLQIHQKTHDPDYKEEERTTYKCQICEKEFLKYRYWLKHKKGHIESKVKEYKCKYCDKIFKRYNYFSNHMLYHSNNSVDKNENYRCEICHLTFKKYRYWHDHKTEHENKNKIVCEICGDKFRRYNIFTIHKNLHKNPEEIYECDKCEKVFEDPVKFHYHKQEHNKIIYKCKLCQEEFSKYHYWFNHNKQHQDNIKVPCSLCDLEFHCYNYLLKHKPFHNVELINFSKVLNDKVNFVFVHIPKCGGSTISRFLKLSTKYVLYDANHNELLKENYNIINFGHASLKHIEDNDMNKIITFVRNPYSRILSLFHWYKLDRDYLFKDFIKQIYQNKKFVKMINNDDRGASFTFAENSYAWKNQTHWIKNKNIFFVGKLENLYDDLKLLCQKINIPFDESTILHRKKSDNHNEIKQYKDFYDMETKLMVEEMYADDLQTFHYKFK
jgi:KRAB domain-containing zinc finger protein